MIPFARELKTTMNEVTTNSHLGTNQDSVVEYPYLTYHFSSDEPIGNQEPFTIEVNIFDYSSSETRILQLEERIKDVFHKARIMTPELFLQFSVGISTPVPTGDEHLKRRDVTIYCKADWRNKEWH